MACRESIAARPDLGWFAIRVKPRHEKSVFRLIEGQGLEQLLPLQHVRRWAKRTRDVQVPIFPGYVFCRFDRSSWARVVQTPGVIDVVRSGGAPVGICSEEMTSLQRLHRMGSAMEPWPYLPAGQTVRISAGPLAGVTGRLVEVKCLTRLVLSVSLLQRSVLVEIDREWLVVAN